MVSLKFLNIKLMIVICQLDIFQFLSSTDVAESVVKKLFLEQIWLL